MSWLRLINKKEIINTSELLINQKQGRSNSIVKYFNTLTQLQ